MTFAELGAHPSLDRALQARGYATPTPVQAAVLAPEHAGRDLLVSSQTGSGKTVAFGLALAPTLLGTQTEASVARKPRVLVITPTRELAQQVSRELAWLYASARVSVATCVGGMDPRAEARVLARGVHIVVGTPGRLVDHLQRKQLPLGDLEAVVLDEGDEMLDMGFRDELETLLKETPAQRRTILFSATLPADIVDLASKYQRQAVRITATPPSGAHQDIEYVAHLIAQREREHALVNTLRVRQESQALCFCETRHAVAHLHASLLERGFSAVALSGELTQSERTRALTALRDGRARVLVATDVAARGLDLPDLGLVIHVDLPHDAQVLQHRSGRTGRAGRKGVAVFLVPFSRKSFAERMLGRARIRPTWAPVPTAEAVRAMDQERLFQELQAEVEPTEEDLQVARRLLTARTPEQLAVALVRSQRGGHPAPEELPETTALIERERTAKAPRPRPASTPFRAAPPTRQGPASSVAPTGTRVRSNASTGDGTGITAPRVSAWTIVISITAGRGDRTRTDRAPKVWAKASAFWLQSSMV